VALYGVNSVTHVHILDNHRFGAGRNKSEFPQSWSDADIIAAVETVANDPASSARPTGAVGRLKVIGNRNSVVIVVIVEIASGVIVTGYPR
jgi:EndoU nuclease-like protein